MQLIGIYLGTHGNPVSKNLKENWYPFGNFDNCHEVKDFSNILKQVKENQTFINKFYNVRQGSGENKPSINLNCIVGKNGSGKSSVLSLLYRIINNLACKLKEILPDYNKDYSPIWAWGFNAELYYEMDGKLGCIEIFDNDKPLYAKERTENLPVRLAIFNAEGNREEILSRKLEISDEDLLEILGKSLFYTIGTNYSLYTNSVVRFDYDESQENWMNTIYHKNDGYFTPIVLVPYRNYNGKNSIIDTEKELRLANERVNTLAILLKASDDSAFIEGFLPKKVVYELKNGKTYRNEIKNKIKKLYSSDDKKDCSNFDETVTKLMDFIGREWEKQFENKKILGTDSSNLKNEKLKNIIFKNIVCYLSYKTIKICIYYDRYKNLFKETGILDDYKNHEGNCKTKIRNIIRRICNNKESTDFINLKKNTAHDYIYNDTEPTDFINLKIRQCIDFLENGAFYLEKINKEKGEVLVDDAIKKFFKKNEEKPNYDSVFLKLLPPIFKKKYVYKKIGSDDETTISQMSSGEQQLLYSLSYAVYHMKNAASNQLQSKNEKN
ncbi:MAG: ATP-binding protein [Treponema sp.]|nr:ATP-binding protein [Treponema sp.]